MDWSRHGTLPLKPFRRARLVHRLDRAVSGAMAVARTADAAAWLSAAFARPAQALGGGAAPRGAPPGGARRCRSRPTGPLGLVHACAVSVPAPVYASLWLVQQSKLRRAKSVLTAACEPAPALTAAMHAWRSGKGSGV
jgi:hypothetical protein